MQGGDTTSSLRGIHRNIPPSFHQLKNFFFCQALQRSQNAPLLLSDKNRVKHKRSSSSSKFQKCFFKVMELTVSPRKITKINILSFYSELRDRLCRTASVPCPTKGTPSVPLCGARLAHAHLQHKASVRNFYLALVFLQIFI